MLQASDLRLFLLNPWNIISLRWFIVCVTYWSSPCVTALPRHLFCLHHASAGGEHLIPFWKPTGLNGIKCEWKHEEHLRLKSKMSFESSPTERAFLLRSWSHESLYVECCFPQNVLSLKNKMEPLRDLYREDGPYRSVGGKTGFLFSTAVALHTEVNFLCQPFSGADISSSLWDGNFSSISVTYTYPHLVVLSLSSLLPLECWPLPSL